MSVAFALAAASAIGAGGCVGRSGRLDFTLDVNSAILDGTAACASDREACALDSDGCGTRCNSGACEALIPTPLPGPIFCNGGMDGTPFGACNDCYSRLCAPYGSYGVKIGLPVEGCHVEGDLCPSDSDCTTGTCSTPPPPPSDEGGTRGAVYGQACMQAGDSSEQTHASVDICSDAESDGSFYARELEDDWTGGVAVEPPLKAAPDKTPPSTSSFEGARNGYHETIRIGEPSGAPDLTKAQLAAPLSNAAFLSGCGAPDEMKVTVRVAVRMGRAVGVTVTTDPGSPVTASCIERSVRRLHWASSPNMDFVTTRY